jgi:hypothetical protein
MRNYKSIVVSVRIAPALLRAVRERARAEGRSTSGEIVSILGAQIASSSAAKKSQPITGWLAHLVDIPETHEEFREARREASARLLRGVDRTGSGKQPK